MNTKALPSAVDLERSLLSSLILLGDPNFAGNILSELSDDCFYHAGCRGVKEVIEELTLTGTMNVSSLMMKASELTVDSKTVSEVLAMKVSPSKEAVRNWSETLRDLAHRRAKIRQLQMVAGQVWELGIKAHEIEAAEMEIIHQNLAKYNPRTIPRISEHCDAFRIHQTQLIEWQRSDDLLRTLIYDIDRHGYMLPEYILIAARPSVGKTAMALGTALRQAMNGHVTLYFSMEQSRENMICKCISMLTGLSGSDVLGLNGTSSENDRRIREAEKYLKTLSKNLIFVFGQLSLDALCGTVYQLYEQRGVQAVYIDQISKFRFSESIRTQERKYALTSQTVFTLQRSLNLPIVMLAQIDHKGLNDNPVPHSEQIKWCGQLKEDVDRCIVIDRPETEQKRFERFEALREKLEADGDMEGSYRADIRGKAYVMQEKDRNGVTDGTWKEKIAFQRDCGLFGPSLSMNPKLVEEPKEVDF